MKKVLLTGSTGLIGKYAIQPLLDEGFEVFAVSSKKVAGDIEQEAGINWVQGNLLENSEIEKLFAEIKPEYLLHFAWDTTPGSYLESNLNFDWVTSSLEMLKNFKANGGKRAVFAGTCFEYKFKEEPLKEDGETNPTSTYAKCKNILHQLADLYCEKNDISFGWGRIFYVYGENENEKRLVPHVINSLKNDKEVLITAGELVKDYMFADDIAGAFAKFLNTDVEGCVNICTAQPVKIKEIVSIIAQKTGKEHLVKFEDNAKDQPQIIVGDNTRLVNEVKYKLKFKLEDALDKLVSKT